jgi:hypothetical protein
MDPKREMLAEMLWERYDLFIEQGDTEKAREISKEIYELVHNTP